MLFFLFFFFNTEQVLSYQSSTSQKSISVTIRQNTSLFLSLRDNCSCGFKNLKYVPVITFDYESEDFRTEYTDFKMLYLIGFNTVFSITCFIFLFLVSSS